MTRIAIGCDKSGFYIKERLIRELSDMFVFIDEGTYEDAVCDYPLFAEKVCSRIKNKHADLGVLVCGSGEGMCIAANKVSGIRCGIAYNDDVARLLRNHNDANVVSFGARFMSYDEIKNRLLIFCNSEFLGEHHLLRIKQICDLEHKNKE